MKIERLGFRGGSVMGYEHARLGINNQDAHMAGEVTLAGRRYVYGAVLDGCTGKKRQSRNEVGAVLLSAFLGSEIPFLLSAGTPLPALPDILYQRCLGYFGQIVRSTMVGGAEQMWNFVQKHLLCTVIGFIVDAEHLVVFHAGDGAILVNSDALILDQGNRPKYLAYHLVSRDILGAAAKLLPASFETEVYETGPMERFAVCTDGFVEPFAAGRLAPDGIWEYEPEARGGLQWWLNLRHGEGLFEDDCAIVALFPEHGQTKEGESK